ncbi:AaceriAEL312CAp [[Ashbya] aceris (nom. inval.)]|nr:AaceriAEL312CAp [[Ashbya] aceris (nom. inval.)]
MTKTIRLLVPQWQGGNQPLYPLGAKLLSFLAPQTQAPTIEVKVPEVPEDYQSLEPEDGIVRRSELENQMEQIRTILDKEQPDKIVLFGGDCLADLAPFAYLNEKHGGNLGVLWLDAHPDVQSTEDYTHGHTMVLSSLLGKGDKRFAAHVPQTLNPKKVMFAGLRDDGLTDKERETIEEFGISYANPQALENDAEQVLAWIERENITHLAVHWDLDVLDPRKFRSVLFAQPDPEEDWESMFPAGRMTFPQVRKLFKSIAEKADIVGLGMTEFLPWDDYHLQNAFKDISILNE